MTDLIERLEGPTGKEMDPKLPHGSRFCLCSGCGEYFTNPRNHALHRRGKPESRFCVYPGDLVTKEGKARLRLNPKGYWAQPGGYR